MRLPNLDAARIDPAKLHDYSLNPEHHRGKHKAHVFQSTLGWTQADTDTLIDAIRMGIRDNDAIERRVDQYGTRYSVDFDVRGDDRAVTIRSTWIIRPSEDFPRLTNCYIL